MPIMRKAERWSPLDGRWTPCTIDQALRLRQRTVTYRCRHCLTPVTPHARLEDPCFVHNRRNPACKAVSDPSAAEIARARPKPPAGPHGGKKRMF